MGIFSKKPTDAKKVTEERQMAAQQAARPEVKEMMMSGENSPIIRTHVTEKAMRGEGQGVYTFVVAAHATKIDIKRAVKETYGVSPKSVRVIWTEGKQSRLGRRRGRRSDSKKAIVTLPKGETISIHEGV